MCLDTQSPKVTSGRGPQPRWQPPKGSGVRQVAIGFLHAWLIALPMLALGGWMMYDSWRVKENARLAAIEAAQAYERLIAGAPGAVLPVAEAVHGRDLFVTVCAACHGAQGTGLQGLGRNLVQSDFVALQSDEELCEFIVTGRPEARPVAMPPRAGREDLTDEDLAHIVVYLRGLQDPRRLPEMPAYVLAPVEPTDAQMTEALAAAGGDPELARYIASGNKLFHSVCIACHGQGGAGIAGNGKPLVRNEFVKSLDNEGLLAFIKQGRGPTDARNTTGIQMPPKGGNPALSDDDILDIIDYLRTLQGDRAGASELH